MNKAKKERRAVTALALLMSFRLFGLFMLLPVFASSAHLYQGATSQWIGLALGIYGLTQALLQIPFGTISDHVGRKPIIVFGLVLFGIGSLICAFTHSIFGIIVGRALQGAGAVGSTLLAAASDLTRDEFRTKAMAIIGMSIGIAFALAMVFGPLINAFFGLSGLFWVTVLMTVVGLMIVSWGIPKLPKPAPYYGVKKLLFLDTIKRKELLCLDFGIFSLHAIITATFLAIPNLLNSQWHLSPLVETALYFVVLLFAFVAVFPIMILSEKKYSPKTILLIIIGLLTFSQIILLQPANHFPHLVFLLWLFFTSFTALEALLPALVSKLSPLRTKGTAMGLYSTSQFLGTFVGGALGGTLYRFYHIPGIFIFCTGLGLLWLIFTALMKSPPHLSTWTFAFKPLNKAVYEQLEMKLKTHHGIREILFNPHEHLLYIKANQKSVNKDQLRNWINESNLSK